ncbi:MAG TPA: ATP-binding protein, partial [Gemmatimonadota bacterium]|nr:ATP-binding protein [Gemmatimonadota bacterium]
MTRPTRDLATAFRDHWDRHFALPEGRRAVVAVSGGLDSMTLLALLAREGAAEPADLVAAHFDHGTRGEESAEDGRFVAEVARRWGVAARLGRGDAPARAAETGRGPMTAARELRYAFLRETAEAEGAEAIVTAHQR